MVDLLFDIIFILLGVCGIVFLLGLCIIGFNVMAEIIKDMTTVRKVE